MYQDPMKTQVTMKKSNRKHMHNCDPFLMALPILTFEPDG